MHSDQQQTLSELQNLVEHSVALGADLRLVQGAGGNISVKAGGVLWIKASGTRLGQARDRQIFVPMDQAATRAGVLETETLTAFVLPRPGSACLRPSIETALHVLLPHTVVFHVHGVGSIAAGLTDPVSEVVSGLPGWLDVVVVPYAKPGVQLARAVLAETPENLSGQRPLVLVLRNHGLVVGAPDATTATEVLHLVEDHVRSAGPPEYELGAVDEPVCPPGTVSPAAARILCAGVLTPDSAVFLGPAPFGRLDTGPPDPGDGRHSGWVAADGSVWLRGDLGADEREVAVSLVDVARQVRGDRVSTLSAAHVAELVNWEAETWRRELKR